MHGRTICRRCSTLISQCRCMEGHSNVSYALCSSCAEGAPLPSVEPPITKPDSPRSITPYRGILAQPAGVIACNCTEDPCPCACHEARGERAPLRTRDGALVDVDAAHAVLHPPPPLDEHRIELVAERLYHANGNSLGAPWSGEPEEDRERYRGEARDLLRDIGVGLGAPVVSDEDLADLAEKLQGLGGDAQPLPGGGWICGGCGDERSADAIWCLACFHPKACVAPGTRVELHPDGCDCGSERCRSAREGFPQTSPGPGDNGAQAGGIVEGSPQVVFPNSAREGCAICLRPFSACAPENCVNGAMRAAMRPPEEAPETARPDPFTAALDEAGVERGRRSERAPDRTYARAIVRETGKASYLGRSKVMRRGYEAVVMVSEEPGNKAHLGAESHTFEVAAAMQGLHLDRLLIRNAENAIELTRQSLGIDEREWHAEAIELPDGRVVQPKPLT
jgi:hypothetical protein